MFFSPKPDKVLNGMLLKAGFNFDNPDRLIAWKTFKDFSVLKIKCADDSMLFQCGEFNFTGENNFYWDLVRQFSFEKHGEYDHMEQLHIEFIFKPSSDLKGLEENLWSSDCDSKEDFFHRVEQMIGFIKPWENHKPIKVEVYLEEV